MDCVIDATAFPLYSTEIALLKDFKGDGSFEVIGWTEVIGQRNVVVELDQNGSYHSYLLTFTPGNSLIDSCQDGQHVVSIRGKKGGEFRNTLNFLIYYLSDGERIQEGMCSLSAVDESNSSDELKLVCKFDSKRSIQFFHTTPYDEQSDTFVWITQTNIYELIDCS